MAASIKSFPTTGVQKMIQVSSGTVAINATTPVVSDFNAIAEGDGFQERMSNVVKIDKIEGRWQVFSDTTAAINRFRLALLWDKAPNKSLITFPFVWNSNDPVTFLEPDINERIDILWDICDGLSGAANASNGVRTGYFCLEDLDLTTVYGSGSSSGAITNIINGGLIFSYFGSAASGTTDCTGILELQIFYRDAFTVSQRP